MHRWNFLRESAQASARGIVREFALEPARSLDSPHWVAGPIGIASLRSNA